MQKYAVFFWLFLLILFIYIAVKLYQQTRRRYPSRRKVTSLLRRRSEPWKDAIYNPKEFRRPRN